jgi:hypothetical protein
VSYQLASDLAHLQYWELRRQAAARQRGTGYHRHPSSPARRRLGFALVEAGLHLLVEETG